MPIKNIGRFWACWDIGTVRLHTCWRWTVSCVVVKPMKVRPALRRELNWSCLRRKFYQATWFRMSVRNKTRLSSASRRYAGEGVGGWGGRSAWWDKRTVQVCLYQTRAQPVTHPSPLTLKLSDFSHWLWGLLNSSETNNQLNHILPSQQCWRLETMCYLSGSAKPSNRFLTRSSDCAGWAYDGIQYDDKRQCDYVHSIRV